MQGLTPALVPSAVHAGEVAVAAPVALPVGRDAGQRRDDELRAGGDGLCDGLVAEDVLPEPSDGGREPRPSVADVDHQEAVTNPIPDREEP